MTGHVAVLASLSAALFLAGCSGGSTVSARAPSIFSSAAARRGRPSAGDHHDHAFGTRRRRVPGRLPRSPAGAVGQPFEIHELPKDDLLVFKINAPGSYDTSMKGNPITIASFPLSAASGRPIELAGPETGTMDAVADDALAAPDPSTPWYPSGGVLQFTGIDPNQGSPRPGLPLRRKAYLSVSLLDSREPDERGRRPVLLRRERPPVERRDVPDAASSYIYYNVPPGRYRLQFSGTSAEQPVLDVIALPRTVSVGFDVP